jgi:hypothetical protein
LSNFLPDFSAIPGGLKLAKAGDKDAALDLVVDLAAAWISGLRDRFKPGLFYVAPHAQEATGDNAIPQTLAAVCAAFHDGYVDTEIVQSDRVYHTGADPMERMAARAQFVGRVTPEAEYVLVDDVTNLGGTLAKLPNFIQVNGGVVRDVVVLVNAGRNQALVPAKKFLPFVQFFQSARKIILEWIFSPTSRECADRARSGVTCWVSAIGGASASIHVLFSQLLNKSWQKLK